MLGEFFRDAGARTRGLLQRFGSPVHVAREPLGEEVTIVRRSFELEVNDTENPVTCTWVVRSFDRRGVVVGSVPLLPSWRREFENGPTMEEVEAAKQEVPGYSDLPWF